MKTTSDYSSDSAQVAPYPRPEHGPPAVGLGRVVTIALSSTGIGGLIGGVVGFAMGVTIPDFYRSELNGGPNVDPVQMGVGLGISEGIAFGFVLGILIVCVLAFGKRRTSSNV